MDDPSKEGLLTIYQQLCESYRAIDESRTKLLSLLPLATGAGILVLSGGGKALPELGLSLPVGLFGIIATLGLFSYELHGIKKCAALIDAGQLIERRLEINGQFLRRPQEVAGFVDEPFAASVIYPASLAGWTFFALLEVVARPVGLLITAAVFLAGFAFAIWLIRMMEADMRTRRQYDREPIWLRRDPHDARRRAQPTTHLSRRRPLPDDAYLRDAAAAPPRSDEPEAPAVPS